MEADCQQMSGRYTALAEQKVYLNEQLKAIMKRNRVLQAEIDFATQGVGGQTSFNGGEDSPFPREEGIALHHSTVSQSIMDEAEDAHILEDYHNRRAQQSNGSRFGERSSQFRSSSDIPASLSVSIAFLTLHVSNCSSISCLQIPHGKKNGMHRGGSNAQSASALPARGQSNKQQPMGGTGMHRQASAPQGLGYGKDCNTPTKTQRRSNNPLSPNAADRQIAAATGITAATYDANYMSHKQKLDAFLAAQ
jgi:hypothetical protein